MSVSQGDSGRSTFDPPVPHIIQGEPMTHLGSCGGVCMIPRLRLTFQSGVFVGTGNSRVCKMGGDQSKIIFTSYG